MFEYFIDKTTSLRLLEKKMSSELYNLLEINREMLREWLPWVDLTNGENDTLAFINR